MWGVVILMLIIAFFEVPSLLKERKYRELTAFFVLWLIAGTYAALVVLDLPLINPFVLITEIVTYINNRVIHFFSLV